MAGDRPSEAPDRTRSALVAVAAVGGVVLVVALLALAAGQGPSRLFTGEGLPHGPWHEGTPTPSVTTPPVSQPGEGHGSSHLWFIWLVAPLIVAGVSVWVLWLLGRLLIAIFRRWEFRRRPPAPTEIAFDVLEHPEVLAEDVVATAERYRQLLAEGSPRNGIVACWHEFERAAERRGLARKPWQTSSEFTLQVLDLLLPGPAADTGAVGRLAGHYREARFSDHEVTEPDRTAARADLEEILANLVSRHVSWS